MMNEDRLGLRPWQLLMVGDGIDQLNTEAREDLARIFDLFPAVSHLVVQTTAGGCRVSRDFSSGYTDEVDQRLAGIFQGNRGHRTICSKLHAKPPKCGNVKEHLAAAGSLSFVSKID